ncbi:MAG: helicase-related protein [Thermoanaerobaculia bacterium]
MSGDRTDPAALPIESLRPAFEEAIEEGPVVVSAPTGSGKSTRVPAWCPGRVLVVEPRRVACRSLAQRVAQLEKAELGREVGYHVRGERRASDATRILFATPGVALRRFDEIGTWDAVVLDEFHERGLETDLLLALLAGRPPARLVVMSATVAGDRVARHLGGRHLRGEGRVHPVEVRYRPGGTLLPAIRGLEGRVVKAVAEARDLQGDVLVFLPGKGEIASCAAALRGSPAVRAAGFEVLELHGGLSLAEQSRAFATGGGRKVILATNVAETSITLPGIGVVVDAGLVRQTRWYRDRGFLTLVPVAADSAEQRAGRAGRTRPGVCLRLWSEEAQLAPRTPPEVHRESLTPLVLAAAALGEDAAELPFLDPPREDALATAQEELVALGALETGGATREADSGARPGAAPPEERGGRDGAGTPRTDRQEAGLTDRGRRLFGLPLDPGLGRILIEAEARRDGEPERFARTFEDVVDLVSALAVDRPLPKPPRNVLDAHADPRAPEPAADPAHCDAVATLVAFRAAARGKPAGPAAEALNTARRLREAFGLPAGRGDLPAPERPVDRRALAAVLLAADPRLVHVARRRGGRRGKSGGKVAWAAGGPELTLARESAATAADDGIDAAAVLATHAVGSGFRKMQLLATCAVPLPMGWLVEEGFGEERLGEPALDGGRIVARVERVWAGRVLGAREEVPRGARAREALAELFLGGRVFSGARERAAERLEAARLAWSLGTRSGDRRTEGWTEVLSELFGAEEGAPDPPELFELAAWARWRIGRLGFESGEDLALLSGEDLLPPELPPEIQAVLDRDYPRRLELPDATYEMEYDPARRTVTLVKTSGGRKAPPSLRFLPRFAGFRVRVRHGQMLRTVREPR